MKKLLALLLAICILPFGAFADGPPRFSEAVTTLTGGELAARMEAALAAALPGASVCTREEHSPAVILGEWDAFCVARRPDGLMSLCCFIPEGDGLRFQWHNDLLLSHWQEITLTTSGAAWSGGAIPDMSFEGGDFVLQQAVGSGMFLRLTCWGWLGEWRVTELGLFTSNGQAILVLPEDCLTEDIDLSRCHPADWNSAEAASW